MEKEIKLKLIIDASYYEKFTFGRLKQILKDNNVVLKDDDFIEIDYDDGNYYFQVERYMLETDEEFNKRKEWDDILKKRNEKADYENYLRLKAKYENG